ncbi:hypothetical protein S40288_09909 [Stachybotrys chartarum IBT 40288]|nr:hypothetical protein S40288_09909 [Stachybotrys chartarum IBT 40288]
MHALRTGGSCLRARFVCTLPAASKWRRYSTRPVETASRSEDSTLDLEAFRARAWIPGRPLVYRARVGSPAVHLPAVDKWFSNSSPAGDTCSSGKTSVLSSYMAEFLDWPFPYELVIQDASRAQDSPVRAFGDWLLSSRDMMDQMLAGIIQPAVAEGENRAFFQLYAPLRLLAKALEFNALSDRPGSQPVQLYIAQSSLSDLPEPLQHDLPTPYLVQKAGKGDVYSSSVWLGTEPTYTPLHRDPNPNLFCQICSSKVVRLLPPSLGEQLFIQVQARIHQRANSRIRTSEMMEGKEREEMHRAVWEPDTPIDELVEARLDSGDALFIPQGWWHSVKSRQSDGSLNGSVNWWFR